MPRRVVVIVVIAAFTAVGLTWFSARRSATLQPGAVVSAPTPSATSSIQSSATSSTTPRFATYSNEKYRFEFQYPQSWGDIQFGETSSEGQTSTDIRGLRKPDTGKIFIGNFSNNAACGFGAITPDYTYGAEGALVISGGWTEENGRYYSLWPSSSIKQLVSGRGPDELFPERVVKIASGTAKALILETPIKDFDGAIIATVLKADVNLPGTIFRGMAFGCSLSPYDSPDKISENRSGVDVMLHSFEYIRDGQS
jgi:hypothetical protein